MRRPSRFASLSVVAAAIAATPAQAAHVPTHGRFGGWHVIPLPAGRCVVRREFGNGTMVHLAAKPGSGLIEIGSPVLEKAANPGPYRISLVVDGNRRPFPGKAVAGRDGLAMTFDPSVLQALPSAGALDVHGAEGVLLKRLYLEGLAAALARLPACMAEGAGPVTLAPPRVPVRFGPAAPPPPPPPPPRRLLTPARAEANLAGLFSSDDYPEAAWQAGEEGSVGFRLQVDRTGRVSACRVTSSSGSAPLDEATCRLIAERARFRPARDHRGKPTEDSFSGRIVWRIPEPEPEPPPQ